MNNSMWSIQEKVLGSSPLTSIRNNDTFWIVLGMNPNPGEYASMEWLWAIVAIVGKGLVKLLACLLDSVEPLVDRACFCIGEILLIPFCRGEHPDGPSKCSRTGWTTSPPGGMCHEGKTK